MTRYDRLSVVLACAMLYCAMGVAQEKSVRPGVNDAFRDPDVKEFVGRFEVESREVYSRRKEIVTACGIQPKETVADIGAGTGLFTRLFADAVGPEGRVIAVDISQKFLDHIQATSRQAGLRNVDTVLCKADSTELPPLSIDVAYICDTYHHFEYPLKTLASLYGALKPGGRVILIDFRRIEGESSDFVLTHVRAGQEVFEGEIQKAGFQKIHEKRELLKENYFVVFRKPDPKGTKSDRHANDARTLKPASNLVFPLIPGHGGVLPRPNAVEQPRAGAKVAFDVTVGAPDGHVNPGLVRVARLLNLYGAAGREAHDVKIAVVLHGEATRSVFSHKAYKARFELETNPSLELIRELQQKGVDVYVCGQALNYKGFRDDEVADGIPIAAAALTVVINRQSEGFAYIPVP